MLGFAALHSSGSHHMPCLLHSVLFIPSSRPPPLLPLSLLLPPAPVPPLSSPGPGPDPVNPTPRPATPPHYLPSLSSHCHLLGRLLCPGFLAPSPFLCSGSCSPVVLRHWIMPIRCRRHGDSFTSTVSTRCRVYTERTIDGSSLGSFSLYIHICAAAGDTLGSVCTIDTDSVSTCVYTSACQ
jgi:hypothetical protein